MINTVAIKDRMSNLNISSKDLSDICEINIHRIGYVINGAEALTLDIADKIQCALNISDCDFGYFFMMDGDSHTRF